MKQMLENVLLPQAPSPGGIGSRFYVNTKFLSKQQSLFVAGTIKMNVFVRRCEPSLKPLVRLVESLKGLLKIQGETIPHYTH